MSAVVPAPLAPDLEAALRRLKLAAVRRLAPEVLGTAKTQRWAPEELLRTLLEAELAARDASNARARLRAAGFPVRKTLEEFQVAESSIPRATFDYLASLEWIRARENLVLVGPAGTGKTVCGDGARLTDTPRWSDMQRAPGVPLRRAPSGRWRPAWGAYRGSITTSSATCGREASGRCRRPARAVVRLTPASGGAATGERCARGPARFAFRSAGCAAASATTHPGCGRPSSSLGGSTLAR